MKDFSELEEKIEYEFKDKSLLELALSHSSYVNELVGNKKQCNERIEFLGDAVLELVSSNYLYRTCPSDKEGVLSRHRASLVCEKSLSKAARRLDLGSMLLLGKGEKLNGGAERSSILADAFEAVIGAMYLDGGYDVAERFIIDNILAEDSEEFIDYKSRFQELVQGHYGNVIKYEVISEEGPEHDRIFEVSLSLDGQILGKGTGHNKKSAEQQAAKYGIDVVLGKA